MFCLQLWRKSYLRNQKKIKADIEKINKLQGTIKLNKDKVKLEDDYKKREILRLKIQIDELKVRIERLK